MIPKTAPEWKFCLRLIITIENLFAYISSIVGFNCPKLKYMKNEIY